MTQKTLHPLVLKVLPSFVLDPSPETERKLTEVETLIFESGRNAASVILRKIHDELNKYSWYLLHHDLYWKYFQYLFHSIKDQAGVLAGFHYYLKNFFVRETPTRRALIEIVKHLKNHDPQQCQQFSSRLVITPEDHVINLDTIVLPDHTSIIKHG